FFSDVVTKRGNNADTITQVILTVCLGIFIHPNKSVLQFLIIGKCATRIKTQSIASNGITCYRKLVYRLAYWLFGYYIIELSRLSCRLHKSSRAFNEFNILNHGHILSKRSPWKFDV